MIEHPAGSMASRTAAYVALLVASAACAIGPAAADRTVVHVKGWPESNLYAHAIISNGMVYVSMACAALRACRCACACACGLPRLARAWVGGRMFAGNVQRKPGADGADSGGVKVAPRVCLGLGPPTLGCVG